LILAGVVVGIALLLYSFDLFHLFTDKARLLGLIEEHRTYAVFIFIGLQVIQVLVAVLPGEVTGFVGGIFFGPLWGIIFSTLGLALGSWIVFNLSRLVGRPLIDILVRQETLLRFDYVMKHKGLFLAFLLFLIPGFPKDILCYLLGLGHMRQGEFLIVSTAGRLLGTTLLTIGGAFLRDERYGALFTIVGISIGLILIILIYRERIESRLRSIHASQRIKALRERRRSKKKHRRGLPMLLLMLALVFLIPTGTVAAEEKITIGEVEDVILIPWGVRLPARIDTGAATSSLDARDLTVKDNLAEFRLPDQYGGLRMHLPVIEWQYIRSAESRERRPVVEIELCIGPKVFRIEVNLNDRSAVKYPLLLGRNALEENFVVDCTQSHCLPPTCPEAPP
jgi:uncharacterized membrane protein YdjX (TVP38/TMEM64 family)